MALEPSTFLDPKLALTAQRRTQTHGAEQSAAGVGEVVDDQHLAHVIKHSNGKSPAFTWLSGWWLNYPSEN